MRRLGRLFGAFAAPPEHLHQSRTASAAFQGSLEAGEIAWRESRGLQEANGPR